MTRATQRKTTRPVAAPLRISRAAILRGMRLVLAVGISSLWLSLVGVAEEPINPEPPVRLQKKHKKPAEAKPDEKKPEEKQPEVGKDEPRPPREKLGGGKDEPHPPREKLGGGKDKEPGAEPAPMEDEAKKTLERISENMRASEDRLAKKDLDEGTKQIQQDIVKDLDALIQQMQQQQQSGGGSSSSSQRNRNRDKQKNGERNQPQQAKGNKGGKDQQKQNGNAQDQTKGQGDNPGKGGDGQTGKNPVADAYKDIWGHLPEKLRQEMDAYGREQFMSKYQDLLKQYYATIAEKGRKRGE